jgi:hypothetical protein
MARMSVLSVTFSLIALVLLPTGITSTLSREAAAADTSFAGVVVEDQVKVRAGAGRTFYVVGNLNKGTKIQVDELLFGWYKVVPPRGVHSYISKAFVNVRGEGSEGTVNRDRAPINAASLDGPGDSYRHQLDLASGDQVTIVGEEGSFYKIVPPAKGGKKSAFVYLPPGSVTRVKIPVIGDAPKPDLAGTKPKTDGSAAADAAGNKATDATGDKATDKTGDATTDSSGDKTNAVDAATDASKGTTDGVANTDATTGTKLAGTGDATADASSDKTADATGATADATADATTKVTDKPKVEIVIPNVDLKTTDTDIVGVPTAASLQKFDVQTPALQVLEEKAKVALSLPLEKQPLEQLIKAYEAVVLMDLSAYDTSIAKARVAQFQRNLRLAAAINAIDLAKSNEPDPELQIEQKDDVTLGAPKRYDVTGQLRASRVYDGRRLPLLLRLVEPRTGKTIVYIRPQPNVDTAGYLGKLVGVTGDVQLDSSLRVRIIGVKELDVLEAVKAVKAIGQPAKNILPAVGTDADAGDKTVQVEKPVQVEKAGSGAIVTVE